MQKKLLPTTLHVNLKGQGLAQLIVLASYILGSIYKIKVNRN